VQQFKSTVKAFLFKIAVVPPISNRKSIVEPKCYGMARLYRT